MLLGGASVVHVWLRSFVCLVCAAEVVCSALGAAEAATDRGAWFWFQSSDPHGAANVVGNPIKEDEAIDFLKQWDVTRLYGSYSTLPGASAAALGQWNKKLAEAGIDSYVVFSEANHILPQNLATLQNLVDTRLVNFNDSRSDPLERFVGIEMDLEPHTLAAWSSGTNADRKQLLLNLRDAYSAVRQRAADGGWGSVMLSAALPVWFDSSSTIGWTSTIERDQWFSDIGGSLDAISLMAYETSSVASIMTSTSYERTSFAGEATIALRSRLGEEWATLGEFAEAMGSVEALALGGIDIESYYRLRQITPAATGDFDGNGFGDGVDFLAWQRGAGMATGASRALGDANGDGDVDAADLAVWARDGVSGGASAMQFVPEPDAATLAGAIVLLFGVRSVDSERATRRGVGGAGRRC
jgi:hypothetical protein